MGYRFKYANIDAALNGLIYTPNTLFSGQDTLQISDTNTYSTFTASANVPITVYPPPTISVRIASISWRENRTPSDVPAFALGADLPGPDLPIAIGDSVLRPSSPFFITSPIPQDL